MASKEGHDADGSTPLEKVLWKLFQPHFDNNYVCVFFTTFHKQPRKFVCNYNELLLFCRT
jgi:hypothetical protein